MYLKVYIYVFLSTQICITYAIKKDKAKKLVKGRDRSKPEVARSTEKK